MTVQLTTPQRLAVLYFRRACLPREQKLAELKAGRRLNSPDPRVTYKLLDLGLIVRGTGRVFWALTDEGRAVAERLLTEESYDRAK